MPPRPNRSRGPNCGSFLTPMISSKSMGLTWGCTVTPRIWASGTRERAAWVSSNAALTSSSVLRPTLTPPTSVLCEIGGEDLHDRGVTQVVGRLGRGLGGGGRQGGGDGNAIRRQDRFRLHLGEHLGLALQALLDVGPGLRLVYLQVVGQPGRGLLDELQVPGIGVHGHEGVHGLLRGLVHRHAAVVQDAHPFSHVVAPHPHRQDRLGLLLDFRDHDLGDFVGVGHGLVSHDDHEAGKLRRLQTDLQGRQIALVGGVPQDVDGIVVAPEGWQKPVELVDSLRAQDRGFSPPARQGVDGHDSRPAGVGDDAQAPAHRPLHFAQALGAVEELPHGLNPDDPGPAEHGVISFVHPGHGAGVGGRGPGPGLAPAGLGQDDGLDAGDGPGGAHEAPGAGHALHVYEDALALVSPPR